MVWMYNASPAALVRRRRRRKEKKEKLHKV